MTPKRADELLALELDCELGRVTIREYLKQLLLTLWREEEGFSGKRPFGNSGWQWDVYIPLVKAGHLPGTVDEDDFLETFDKRDGDKLMAALIERCFEERGG